VRTCLAALCGSLLVAGCGSGEAGDDRGRASDLRATREDGSRIDFPGSLHAWCGARTLHVIGGELPGERRGENPPPFWYYSQRLHGLEQGSPVALEDAPAQGAVMFVYDAKTDNELATDVEDTVGRVEVEEWVCDDGDTVHIVFDGTLGSEFGDAPSVKIVGEVEAQIGEPQQLPER
jgi:hypothetical protein